MTCVVSAVIALLSPSKVASQHQPFASFDVRSEHLVTLLSPTIVVSQHQPFVSVDVRRWRRRRRRTAFTRDSGDAASAVRIDRRAQQAPSSRCLHPTIVVTQLQPFASIDVRSERRRRAAFTHDSGVAASVVRISIDVRRWRRCRAAFIHDSLSGVTASGINRVPSSRCFHPRQWCRSISRLY